MRRRPRVGWALVLAVVLGCAAEDEAPSTTEGAPPASAPLPAPPSTPAPSASSPVPAAKDPATSKTELVSGVLVVHTNVPAAASACTGAGCDDADGDGLVDAWEDRVLDRVRPRIEFDEKEQILTDTTGKVAEIARVTREGSDVLVFIILGYSKDYGSCGFTGHNGDNERVVVDLSIAANGTDAKMKKAYTAAHEGSPADDRHIYADDASLAKELRFVEEKGEPRWLVLASRDKHATYANDATCAAHSSIPCLSESCTANDVKDVDAFRLLPPFVNAGEPAAHLADDLTAVGFPGETAWGDKTFCGGLGGTGCAGGNADKLTNIPF